jgi:hypothetical protein
MKKIFLFLIITIIIFCGIGYLFEHRGSLSIHFIDKKPYKVIINDNNIIGINNTYFVKTDYGPIHIKIYYDDNKNTTSLKIFHENNWYQSKMEIKINDNNILEIKYIEDLTKILEYENVFVEIGKEIIFSWL